MNRRNTAASAIIAVLLAGCGQIPLKPAPTHISAADAPSAEGQIPPPVQVVPVLPKPEPTTRPETYSVVVNNVDVHDLLFALARDAKVNVDIEPGITGKVTLNAIDQTLPQLLTRIGRQVDMRYELHGADLVVMRDTPYLHVYRVDYVNLTRDAKSVANLSTQVSGSTAGGSSGNSGQNNSTSTITSRFEQQVLGHADRQREGHPARDRQDPAHERRDAGGSAGAGRGGAAAGGGQDRGAERDAGHFSRSRVGHRQPGSRHSQHPRHLAPARQDPGVPRPGDGEREAPGADRGDDRRSPAQQPVPARDRLVETAHRLVGIPVPAVLSRHARRNQQQRLHRRLRARQLQLHFGGEIAGVLRQRARALEPEDQRAEQSDRGAEGGRQPGLFHRPGQYHCRREQSVPDHLHHHGQFGRRSDSS